MRINAFIMRINVFIMRINTCIMHIRANIMRLFVYNAIKNENGHHSALITMNSTLSISESGCYTTSDFSDADSVHSLYLSQYHFSRSEIIVLIIL